MKILAIVIKNYNEQFKEEIISLSPEYEVRYDFEKNILDITKSESFIEGVYGDAIYSITPIIGQNGTGKSTLVQLIGNALDERVQDSRLGFLQKSALTASYFLVFENGEKGYYLECFNLYPTNLKENNNKEVTCTARELWEYRKKIEKTIGSIYISKDYEYNLIDNKRENYIYNYEHNNHDGEVPRWERILYMPIDYKAHKYADISYWNKKISDYNISSYIKRDYMTDTNCLEDDYFAFQKLHEYGMLTSDWGIKFNIPTLNTVYGYNTHGKEKTISSNEIEFNMDNLRDCLGNIYVSFASNVQQVNRDILNAFDVAINIENAEDYNRFNSVNANDNYNKLQKSYSDRYEDIEKILFSDIDSKISYGMDKLKNSKNIASNEKNDAMELLEKYYELNKKLIIYLYMIRKHITPAVGYLILNLKQDRYSEEIKLFLKAYEDLSALYGINSEEKSNSIAAYDYDRLADIFNLNNDNEDAFHDHIDAIEKAYKCSKNIVPILTFDTSLTSSGEERIIKLVGTSVHNIGKLLFRCNYSRINNLRVIPVIVDELETNMHLEWSRNYINVFSNILREYILSEVQSKEVSDFIANKIINNIKIQLIFTTHSPFMLSDIVQNNAIVLTKDEDGTIRQSPLKQTFATNIQEIMARPMFVQDCYGSHAMELLNAIIADLRKREDGENLNTPDSSGDDENRYLMEKYKNLLDPESELKIINNIGEEFLRNKLMEMYREKYRITTEDSKEKEIKLMQEELNKVMIETEMNHEQREKIRQVVQEYWNNN